jgi:myosin regulatory light chain 12
MFGVKMNGMDPEEVIKSAFSCFDESASGYLSEDYFKELLMTMGDRFTEAEVSLLREVNLKLKAYFI